MYNTQSYRERGGRGRDEADRVGKEEEWQIQIDRKTLRVLLFGASIAHEEEIKSLRITIRTTQVQ